MTAERNYMLNGPYTGVMLVEPKSPRRSLIKRIAYVVFGLGVVGAALAALAH